MKIKLLVIGKTNEIFIDNLIKKYLNKLNHYVCFEMDVIPRIKRIKSLSEEQQKYKEGLLIIKKKCFGDYFILLDEKGHCFRSVEFADFLQKKMNTSFQRLVFVIGGPYGFSNDVYKKVKEKVSLSSMTFSHQIIRILAVEQIYRAFTILKNAPYHHE